MNEAQIRNTRRDHSPSPDSILKHERIREMMTETAAKLERCATSARRQSAAVDSLRVGALEQAARLRAGVLGAEA